MVEVYNEQVRSRGARQQDARVSASPDDFGAQIGRATGLLSAGMRDVAGALELRNGLKAEDDARDAQNRFLERSRQIRYDPQTGYLNQTGNNALDRRAAFEQQLTQAREEAARGLSPQARRAYDRMTDAHDNSVRETFIRHESSQLRAYTNDTLNAETVNYANEALLAYNNPAQFQQNITQAVAAHDRFGALNGLSPEAMANSRRDLISGIHASAVMRMADEPGGAARANQFLNENLERFNATDRAKLQEVLRPIIRQQQARSIVSDMGAALPRPADAYSGGGRNGGVAAAQISSYRAMIRGGGNPAAGSRDQMLALGAFGIAAAETGHMSTPYGATGPVLTRPDGSTDRAYGKYQVMGANIPSWTARWAGRRMTPEEFLADEAAQEAVFAGQFGSYVDRFGNLNDAATAWFAGPGGVGRNRSDGFHDTNQYLEKFWSGANTALQGARSGGTPAGEVATERAAVDTSTDMVISTQGGSANRTALIRRPDGSTYRAHISEETDEGLVFEDGSAAPGVGGTVTRPQNEAADTPLGRAGFEDTPFNQYFFDEFGAEVGASVLNAPPGARMETILGDEAARELGVVGTTAGAFRREIATMYGAPQAPQPASGEDFDFAAAYRQALAIEDPELQAAVIAELDMRRRVTDQAQTMERQEVFNQHWERGVTEGRWDLPAAVRLQLGADLSSAFDQAAVAFQTGQQYTEPTLYGDLTRMAVENPDQFIGLELGEHLGSGLNNGDYVRLHQLQTELRNAASPEERMQVLKGEIDVNAAMNTNRNYLTDLLGFDPTNAEKDEERAMAVELRRAMQSAMAEHVQRTGAMPTPTDMLGIIDYLTTTVSVQTQNMLGATVTREVPRFDMNRRRTPGGDVSTSRQSFDDMPADIAEALVMQIATEDANAGRDRTTSERHEAAATRYHNSRIMDDALRGRVVLTPNDVDGRARMLEVDMDDIPPGLFHAAPSSRSWTDRLRGPLGTFPDGGAEEFPDLPGWSGSGTLPGDSFSVVDDNGRVIELTEDEARQIVQHHLALELLRARGIRVPGVLE